MDDFIDDDDDVVPVGSMDGDGSATSSRHLVSTVPIVDASAFAAELAHHLLDAMYLAAIDCIQKMAQGVTSFGVAPPCDADAAPKDMVPTVIALLLIDGHHLPEVIHVMHDNGVAQCTAFYDFYCWRRYNDGTHRSPAMPFSSEEGNVANNMSMMPGGLKGSQLKHKHTHDMVISSDNNSNNGNFVVNLAILEAEPEKAEKAVQSLQPKAPIMPVTLARNRQCNIRAIRKEDAEVLETHCIQCQAEEEVNHHMQMAAGSSPNDHKDSATSQTSVIVPIEVNDDDNNDSNIMVGGDDEIIVSGTMPPAASSTVEVDIGKIGTPTLINTGHFDDQSDVMIPGFIAAQLKLHQLQGMRFMWRNLVMLSNHQSSTGDKGTSSSGRLILAQHGCILAHSMGLGKTLQTISLIYMLLNAVSTPMPIPDFVGSNFNTRHMLILCPPTIQANWTAEFWKWTGVHHSMADVSSYHKAIDGPLLPLGFGDNDSILRKGGMDHCTKLCILQALHHESRRVVMQVVNFGLM
ncbi:hypothetical protein GGI24_003331 [Coemansia furcata]|nr:hypothetical protein GGI24_003331 [Coemansia furcata]